MVARIPHGRACVSVCVCARSSPMGPGPNRRRLPAHHQAPVTTGGFARVCAYVSMGACMRSCVSVFVCVHMCVHVCKHVHICVSGAGWRMRLCVSLCVYA